MIDEIGILFNDFFDIIGKRNEDIFKFFLLGRRVLFIYLAVSNNIFHGS